MNVRVSLFLIWLISLFLRRELLVALCQVSGESPAWLVLEPRMPPREQGHDGIEEQHLPGWTAFEMLGLIASGKHTPGPFTLHGARARYLAPAA